MQEMRIGFNTMIEGVPKLAVDELLYMYIFSGNLFLYMIKLLRTNFMKSIVKQLIILKAQVLSILAHGESNKPNGVLNSQINK